jgi:MOSC domain-containing protein YiiM
MVVSLLAVTSLRCWCTVGNNTTSEEEPLIERNTTEKGARLVIQGAVGTARRVLTLGNLRSGDSIDILLEMRPSPPGRPYLLAI